MSKMMKDKIDSEQKSKIQKQLNEIRTEQITIYNYEKFIDKVLSVISALDVDVRNNEFQAGQIYDDIKLMRQKFENQQLTWDGDPWYGIINDYTKMNEQLLNTSAYKTWMIVYYDLCLEKMSELVKFFKDQHMEVSKIQAEKENLNIELEKLKVEKDNIARLFDMVKSNQQKEEKSDASESSSLRQIQSILRQQGNMILAMQQQMAAASGARPQPQPRQSRKPTAEELIDGDSEAENFGEETDEEFNNEKPLQQPQPKPTQPQHNEEQYADLDTEIKFDSPEEQDAIEKEVFDTFAKQGIEKPTTNMNGFRVLVDSKEELAEIIGQHSYDLTDDEGRSSMLITIDDNFKDFLYSKDALAGYLNVSKYKLMKMISDLRLKNIDFPSGV